jgi:mono/diheme cytochrome c family protein
MKTILTLSALLATSAFAADAPAPKADAAAKADPAAAAYKAKCSACHAKDGTGNPAMVKMFKVKPEEMNLVDEETAGEKDEDLAKVIETGKGRMPAFGKDKLKDVTVKDLIAYLRSLAPKKDAKAEKPAAKEAKP